MRNTHIDLHDALDRALVAIGNDYPAGHLLDAHAHRRAQRCTAPPASCWC